MSSVRELLSEGTKLLKEKGLNNPAKDSELLLCFALNLNKLDLYTNPDRIVTPDKKDLHSAYLKRRAAFEPISYITGHKEFMNSVFLVNRNVLIPRPETEHLVEQAVTLAKELNSPKILDLGTGSGCIAVCLKKSVREADITAVDISEAALMTARKNAKGNGVPRIRFLRSDLFDSLGSDEAFNIIVSNPPYVTNEEYESLLPETRLFEPENALRGGGDGLDFYRKILFEAPSRLLPEGHILFEVGYRQAGQVSDMIESSGKFGGIKVVRDLAYVERVVIARKI